MRYVYLYWQNEPAPRHCHRAPKSHGIAGVCYEIVAQDGTEFCYPLALYRVIARDEPDPTVQVDENAWDSGGS